MLIVFLIVLCTDILFTSFKKYDNSFNDRLVVIEGIVKNKVEKKK